MIENQESIKIPIRLIVKKKIKSILVEKKLILTLFFIGIILASIISFLLPKYYRATGSLALDYKTVNSKFLENSGSLGKEISLLKSDSITKQTTEILAKEGISVSKNDILKSGEFKADKASANIYVSMVSKDAEKSSNIVNTIMQIFNEFSLLNSREPYIAALKAISEREDALQEEIQRTNAGLGGTKITTLSSEQEQIIDQIAEFESELESVELKISFYNRQLEKLQKLLEEKYPEISSSILSFESSKINNSKTKLQRLEIINLLSRVQQRLTNFQIEYPWEQNYNISNLNSAKTEFATNIDGIIDVVAKNKNVENIAFLKALSKRLFENQVMVSAIDNTKLIIFNIMRDLENSFNRIPFSIIDVARQSRLQKFNNNLSIKIKIEKLRLKKIENNFYAEVESIKNAEPPDSYFSPNTTLYIFLGGLLGFLSGIFFAVFFKSNKIDLIKSSEDLEESDYKIIAQIPSFPEGSSLLFDSLSRTEKDKVDPKILNAFDGISVFLKYGSLDKPLKTIMVASGQDGEGKSVIAANVALALANDDNKVLLVDVDLKNPQLNKYFKLKSTPSLAHYLFRKKELDEIIRTTHNKNLNIITCIEFPQNPSVIITSERMKNFMSQVAKDYDYVVYDTCSLCKLKETAEIAKEMDEVILVIRANTSKILDVANAENLLKVNGINNFNVVLNDVKT